MLTIPVFVETMLQKKLHAGYGVGEDGTVLLDENARAVQSHGREGSGAGTSGAAKRRQLRVAKHPLYLYVLGDVDFASSPRYTFQHLLPVNSQFLLPY